MMLKIEVLDKLIECHKQIKACQDVIMIETHLLEQLKQQSDTLLLVLGNSKGTKDV